MKKLRAKRLNCYKRRKKYEILRMYFLIPKKQKTGEMFECKGENVKLKEKGRQHRNKGVHKKQEIFGKYAYSSLIASCTKI